MYTLIIENEKHEQLELTNNENYDVISIDGLNPPAALINMIEISGVDGAHFNSSRINTRNIVIMINIKAPVEKNRIALYAYFKAKRYVKVIYRNESRDVYAEGYVETFENDLFTMLQQPQISIICPNPFWLSSQDTSVEFSSTQALFEFPMDNPVGGLEFSSIDRLTTTLINAGEVATGGIIRLRATSDGVQSPTFYNRTTGAYFGLSTSMQEGDEIVINTLTGEKSVKRIRSGTETNLLSLRTSGSAWIVFEPGENEISYSATHGQAYLKVSVELTQKFEGV
jgi:phage-related protein